MKQSTFTSAGFLIGLFILLLNDFYLKESYGNWFTGKLSDFAGLFIFPIFLSLFNHKRIWLNYVFSGVIFVFWKLDYSTEPLIFFNKLFHTAFSRVVDYSDLIALSVLPFSYWYSNKAQSLNFQFLKPVIVCLAVFSFYATSAPEGSLEEQTRITGKYHKIWNHNGYGKDVFEIGYKEDKSCKTCFETVVGPDVLTYGYNQDFILAKINPATGFKIDTTREEYAIVVVSNKRKIYHNLSEKEFRQKRKELNVPDSVVLRIR